MSDDPDLAEGQQDIRPIVAAPSGGRGPWLFGAGLLLAALLLFQALEGRRAGLTAPATAPLAGEPGTTIGSPPDLTIPDAAPQAPAWATWPQPQVVRPVVVSPPVTQAVTPPVTRGFPGRAATANPVASTGAGAGPPAWPVPQAGAPAAAAWPQPAPSDVPGAAAGKDRTSDKDRVRASQFANPSTTVPKGTVVQAVLESALDSTRAGFARAIVARDVWSFDGSRVVIQRGSRLTGEYKSDVGTGQSRVLIQWQRLMRPDGVMIELDSPSADPLGRAGIKGSVNTHFFERFGGAILQSALQIGEQLATRAATKDAYILALPGSMPNITGFMPDKIAPTVKVRQGTSVSVFVARDLDFTGF